MASKTTAGKRPAKQFKSRGIKAADLTAQVAKGVVQVMTSEDWKKNLEFQSKFWNYSFRNQMLITWQKPEASLVAGFQKWRSMGRHVKKGERGIAILAPLVVKKKEKDKNGKEVEKRGLAGFRVAYVFDVSQTKGAKLPVQADHKLKGAAPEGLFEALEKITRDQGLGLELEDLEAGLGGYVNKEKIVINSNNDELQQVKTLAHELTHFFCGHTEKRGQELTRDHRELEAESGAYIVGQALGLDFSEYSFNYLASWSRGKDMEEVQKDLVKAGEVAAKAAKKLLKLLDPEAAEIIEE